MILNQFIQIFIKNVGRDDQRLIDPNIYFVRFVIQERDKSFP